MMPDAGVLENGDKPAFDLPKLVGRRSTYVWRLSPAIYSTDRVRPMRTSESYHIGLLDGKDYAHGQASTKPFELSRRFNCDKRDRIDVVVEMFGVCREVEKVDDYAWGVRCGLLEAAKDAKQCEELQAIHAKEQADAKRRRTKPLCVGGCGKRTVRGDGLCRACHKTLKDADHNARPDVIAKKAVAAKLKALGPTLLRKDLSAKGLSKEQIDAFGPPDLIVEKRAWRRQWTEHHYAVSRLSGICGNSAPETALES